MSIANRPDCAYFLLLGLCGAAFLLTIGGILTYVAFNPGAMEGRPESAMSHIPHFRHHTHHPQHVNPHHAGETHHSNSHHGSAVILETSTHHMSGKTLHHNNVSNATGESGSGKAQNETHPLASGGNLNKSIHDHMIDDNVLASYTSKAKQSLVLAIIGPLSLLMGILVTLVVGVLALKYDCDHEPEANISFLRLRSEMSLNLDPDKNNYELLRAMPSSSIDEAGGSFSIYPTGLSEQAS